MSEVNNNTPAVESVVNPQNEVNNNPTDNVAEQKESTPAPQTTKKKYKIKVDGQEIEEELDLSDEESIKRHLQMSKAAQKRMQEAALTKRQAENFIKALQENPLEVLQNDKIMGQKKFREIAETFLMQQLEAEMLSPEQRAQKEMERKLREYEEREKAAREKAEQEQAAQLEAHYAEQFEKVIVGALNESSLPKNPFTVKRMAELLQKNIQHGLELEPKQLAQLVREDYVRELNALVGGADAEAIISMFGDDVAKKIRKYDLEKLKTGRINHQNSQKEADTPKPSQKRYMSRDEWRAELDKKIRE